MSIGQRFHTYICMHLWPRVPVLGDIAVWVCDWLDAREEDKDE